MNQNDDDRFRPRMGKNRQRGDAFINRVIRQTNKAGAKAAKAGRRPGSRLGRGHVAARFASDLRISNARRVTIKTRLVNLGKAGARSTSTHLRYIEREGVGRQGEPGKAYDPLTDDADLKEFEKRGRKDRHQFRFIVSPEDAEQIGDLRSYTRQLMARMEADLGTGLEWVAVDHWNTDNPHTHIVLRGKDNNGKDLIISRDYIAEGMRMRASTLATEWLGPRTELEIQQTRLREVEQERWTTLDRILMCERADDGRIYIERFAAPRLQSQRQMLIGRLQRLTRMGLASEHQSGIWQIHADAEATLRVMGERGDIIRTMQRTMKGKPRELMVFQPEKGDFLVGRVAGKGLADELYDKGYLVVDGLDGKAHYVTLPPRAELEQYQTGALVEVKPATYMRPADQNIVALAAGGLYRADHHLAVARQQNVPNRDPQELVASYVRRLEALRRAGIVERIAEGVWRVPGELPERGRQYDVQRLAGGAVVELKSHLPIERQIRVIGATWLDQQLIGGGRGLGDMGFGGEVKDALRQRANFLIEQGLAEKRGQRVYLARNLLETLRERELVKAAQDIAAETGLEHRHITDGKRISGIYRRSIKLASGRYAMLEDGKGFSLVPWKSVVEKRLGNEVSVMVRGNRVSWDIGRRQDLHL